MVEMTLKEVKMLLGTPFYETDGFLLYNRDCLGAMRLLKGDFVDLTVTSPPYNIGKEYEKSMPLEDYLDWCQTWINGNYLGPLRFTQKREEEDDHTESPAKPTTEADLVCARSTNSHEYG